MPPQYIQQHHHHHQFHQQNQVTTPPHKMTTFHPISPAQFGGNGTHNANYNNNSNVVTPTKTIQQLHFYDTPNNQPHYQVVNSNYTRMSVPQVVPIAQQKRPSPPRNATSWHHQQQSHGPINAFADSNTTFINHEAG